MLALVAQRFRLVAGMTTDSPYVQKTLDSIPRLSSFTHFMNTQTFTTVRTTRTPMEAGLFISILENAGLHPVSVDTASNFAVAGAEVDYPVRVPTAEAAEAREILNSYDKPAAKSARP